MIIPIDPDVGAAGAPPGSGNLIRRIWRDTNGRIGLVLTALLLIVAVCGALGFLPHDPLDQFPDRAISRRRPSTGSGPISSAGTSRPGSRPASGPRCE